MKVLIALSLVGLVIFLLVATNAPFKEISLDTFFPKPPSKAFSGTAYYVDCNGSDSNSGTSDSAAWRSINRANQANLNPGDALLFKTGCTFMGMLLANWHGNATNPITISSYGSQSLPVMKNNQDTDQNIYANGSYLILEKIQLSADISRREVGCGNNAVGKLMGIQFGSNASNNLVQNAQISDLAMGINLSPGSHHNKILHNIFLNNNMMVELSSGGAGDYGAFGINIQGDDNEVAFNELSGHDACSYDYVRDGAAIEIYGGQRNTIHHNKAVNNDTFTELGNSRSADNTYAYNQISASLAKASFLVTRGASDSFGPVARTSAYNNTVYLNGANAIAVNCVNGCGSSILTLKNNIIWSDYIVVYSDQTINESNNLYWKTNGQPFFNSPTLSASSKLANPQFVNLSGSDLHLNASSPAINAGTTESVNAGFTSDYDQKTVPQGGVVDLGAFESGTSPTIIPSPTRTPIPTAAPSSPPIQGDADFNGKVDIFDYNIVLRDYGKSGILQGDLDRDNDCDIFDYNIILRDYGKSS